jgi:hypothetical protein
LGKKEQKKTKVGEDEKKGNRKRGKVSVCTARMNEVMNEILPRDMWGLFEGTGLESIVVGIEILSSTFVFAQRSFWLATNTSERLCEARRCFSGRTHGATPSAVVLSSLFTD